MKLPGIFITGTDTDVGKTYIGAQLCQILYGKGIDVMPRKPVESGCDRNQDGELLPHDALAYFAACHHGIPLHDICPYRYTAAVAPDQAARLAGGTLHLGQLTDVCQRREEQFLLVEGAGGFYSPIAEDGLNADLAVELDLPVLLVAADRLGAINHSLLTAEAIKHRGLKLLAVILNGMETKTENEQMGNAAYLRTHLNCPVLTVSCNAQLDTAISFLY